MKTLFSLPPAEKMYEALCRRDEECEGVFYFGVRTTGIFCRPTCPAKIPNRENVEYFPTTSDALTRGFRPCKRCRPMESYGQTPGWLAGLLKAVEEDRNKRWTDQDLRDSDCQPARVRRWFKENHGMTFLAYLRARRLGNAIGQINVGSTNTTEAAIDIGYESSSGFRDAFKKWFGENPQSAKNGLTPIIVNRILSPLGPLIVAAVDEKICLLEFANRRMLETQFKRVQMIFGRAVVPGDAEIFLQTKSELHEYFLGQRTVFEIPTATEGTPFQKLVWKELAKIPYGETTSYDQIAKRIGRSGASRAVGRANGDNRIAIVIPCHRVVRSDGSLSGYGGGVWRKQWMLEHEGVPKFTK